VTSPNRLLYTRCMPRSDEWLREYAAEHLFYEIESIAGLVGRMARFRKLLDSGQLNLNDSSDYEILDRHGRNADIEAFAMHIRNVLGFLYASKAKGADVTAVSYFDSMTEWTRVRPEPRKSLRRVNDRVPVEISHLSTRRADGRDKTWLYDVMWRDLAHPIRAFVNNVPKARVSAEFVEAVCALLPAVGDPLGRPAITAALAGATLADERLRVTSTATIYTPVVEPPSGATAILTAAPETHDDGG
jgi:hypothetical protein